MLQETIKFIEVHRLLEYRNDESFLLGQDVLALLFFLLSVAAVNVSWLMDSLDVETEEIIFENSQLLQLLEYFCLYVHLQNAMRNVKRTIGHAIKFVLVMLMNVWLGVVWRCCCCCCRVA
jgi:hypothetical protein